MPVLKRPGGTTAVAVLLALNFVALGPGSAPAEAAASCRGAVDPAPPSVHPQPNPLPESPEDRSSLGPTQVFDTPARFAALDLRVSTDLERRPGSVAALPGSKGGGSASVWGAPRIFADESGCDSGGACLEEGDSGGRLSDERERDTTLGFKSESGSGRSRSGEANARGASDVTSQSGGKSGGKRSVDGRRRFPEALLEWDLARVSCRGRGLQNLGNSCYLNAVLQALTHTPAFANLCLARAHSRNCRAGEGGAGAPGKSSEGGSRGSRSGSETGGASASEAGGAASAQAHALHCLFCDLEAHVRNALDAERRRSVAPRALLCSVRALLRQGGGGAAAQGGAAPRDAAAQETQEDSHEALCMLLDSLRDVSRRAAADRPPPSPSAGGKAVSFVDATFGGKLESLVRCLRCHRRSTTAERFLHLSLDMPPQVSSVEGALELFTRPELLDGGAEVFQCDACAQLVQASKRLRILRAPRVLALHLKRFAAEGADKDPRAVEFPLRLSLARALAPAGSAKLRGRQGSYRSGPAAGQALYAVVEHEGESRLAGHYLAYVRDCNDQWWEMNDAKATPVSARRVLEAQAYLLFYSRSHSA